MENVNIRFGRIEMFFILVDKEIIILRIVIF